jgi:hypothetical protein
MKNIHLLPTDKPSILFLNNVNKKLLIDNNGTLKNVLPIGLYHNIYITSDEEIKEGDWFYNIVSLKPEAFKACENGDRYVNCSKYSHYRIDCKKIILTTDQDLIKDGVQAIDDEFLEWFVENPTYEEVEVYEVNGKLFAEPIIPQESPETENIQKTAVEYLFEQLWETPKDKFTWNAILEKAKEMEKEQQERLIDETLNAYGMINNLKTNKL